MGWSMSLNPFHLFHTEPSTMRAPSTPSAHQPLAAAAQPAKPARLGGLRALHAQELAQVSGGLSVLGEVLKLVKGGGSVPPKKP